MTNQEQFQITKEALQTFDLETIWKTHQDEGINKLFLIHDGEKSLKIGCKCTNDIYERIDVETTECDVFTFAVILTFLNNNPFFDDKEIQIEFGAYR